MALSLSPPAWAFSPVDIFNEASSLGAAALAYARLDIPVFPLQPRGKVPLVSRGVYAATCDAETISTWWQRNPQANIGVPTGAPSGWWVLDVDPRHGGHHSLEQLKQASALTTEAPLDATRIQVTGGGGLHLCYHLRRDLDIHFSNAVKFAGYPGLDLRVAGGYIVVAPSLHQSGRRYCWQGDTPPALFPQLLVEYWRASRQREFARPPSPSRAGNPDAFRFGAFPSRETDPEYWLRCALRYGDYGCRHNYACFLACHLLDDVGFAPEQAEPYLITYAQQVPQDGSEVPVGERWSIAEALSCLEWAANGRTSGGGGEAGWR